MSQVTIIHKEDVGATLDTSSGKLEAAASMTTDAELAAQATTQAAVDAAQNQAMVDAIAAQDLAENTAEELQRKRDLYYSRFQQFLQHNTIWELQGTKIKAHTTAGTARRLMGIAVGRDADTDADGVHDFAFPLAGATVKCLNSGGADKIVDTEGFLDLTDWMALWYRVPVDGANAHTGEWAYSAYNAGTFAPDSSWIIVAQTNADFSTMGGYRLQLSTGRVLHQGINHPEGGDRVGGFIADQLRTGRRNLGVFEGFIYTRTTTNSAIGGFASTAGATFNPVVGTDVGNAVVHFKLPWRADETAPNNRMYRLEFEGHSLNATGAQKIIKTTVSGYAHQGGLVSPSVIGSNAATTTQYKGSDGYVYVRMEFTNAYCLTVVIDSMAVGNGEAMPHGSITAHFDNAATL